MQEGQPQPRVLEWVGAAAVSFWPLTFIVIGSTLIGVGLAAVSSAVMVGGVLLVVALVMILVGLFVFLQKGPAGVVAESSRRFRAASFKIRWSSLALRLGWDASFGDGEKRVPDLLSASVRDPERIRIEVRPTAKHPKTRWGEMAEQLRREFEAASSSWTEPRPGVLAIDLHMKPLPTSVDFDLGKLSFDMDAFGLGQGYGEVTTWRPFEVPHMLVSGATNGGKGGVLRVVALQAVSSGWRVFGINPRMSGEFGWLQSFGCPVANDLLGVQEMMRWLFEEVSQRQAVVLEAGAASWQVLRTRGELPKEWSPIMVVVDEAASLLTPNKANKELAAMQTEIGDLLARIAMVGRAVGVHLIVATQRPDAGMLGPAGGQLRNNLEARVAVGSMDADGVRMMFGSVESETREALLGIKGRGVVANLSAGSSGMSPTQIFYLDETGEAVRRVPVRVMQGLFSGVIGGGRLVT